MGALPSSISRDSLYPESARQEQNRGKFAGREGSGLLGTEERQPDPPPAPPPAARRRVESSGQEQRRRDGIDGEHMAAGDMQSLSEELNRRPPAWEYRIDEYGKVAKRTRTPTVQKLKEEPLVPLGILGTVAILFMASREFQRGDSRQMNRYLWWRVYAQGGTIAMMVAGSIYYESTRAARVEQEARRRGWPVEAMRVRAGWTEDGSERLSGRRAPSFFDPFRRLASSLSR